MTQDKGTRGTGEEGLGVKWRTSVRGHRPSQQPLCSAAGTSSNPTLVPRQANLIPAEQGPTRCEPPAAGAILGTAVQPRPPHGFPANCSPWGDTPSWSQLVAGQAQAGMQQPRGRGAGHSGRTNTGHFRRAIKSFCPPESHRPVVRGWGGSWAEERAVSPRIGVGGYAGGRGA